MVGLFDQITVKGFQLKNRIVMPPMETGLSTVTGTVTDDLIKHYVARGKEIGLQIIEDNYVG